MKNNFPSNENNGRYWSGQQIVFFSIQVKNFGKFLINDYENTVLSEDLDGSITAKKLIQLLIEICIKSYASRLLDFKRSYIGGDPLVEGGLI